ncbi:MAG: hypothetical protein M0R66_01725 [Candidatus Omnitrophica bacterium]|nr:hypothetical protein [Candidatus Omnitrophota bacterium]
MPLKSKELIIIRLISILLLLGGLAHWLVIFGILEEKVTPLIDLYFHSLAILSPLAALGLWRLKNWGRILAIAICLTQFPAHFTTFALEISQKQSLDYWRIWDLLFSLTFIFFLTQNTVKKLFLRQNG